MYGITNSLVGSGGGSASVEQNGQLLMDFKSIKCTAPNASGGQVPMLANGISSDFSASSLLAEDFQSITSQLTYPEE